MGFSMCTRSLGFKTR